MSSAIHYNTDYTLYHIFSQVRPYITGHMVITISPVTISIKDRTLYHRQQTTSKVIIDQPLYTVTKTLHHEPYFLLQVTKYLTDDSFSKIPHYHKPEDHWSYIAHLIAEDMLKSAVIEEKKFKHSPWAGADNPLGPKF